MKASDSCVTSFKDSDWLNSSPDVTYDDCSVVEESAIFKIIVILISTTHTNSPEAVDGSHEAVGSGK